jgi:hypothetical protein
MNVALEPLGEGYDIDLPGTSKAFVLLQFGRLLTAGATAGAIPRCQAPVRYPPCLVRLDTQPPFGMRETIGCSLCRVALGSARRGHRRQPTMQRRE